MQFLSLSDIGPIEKVERKTENVQQQPAYLLKIPHSKLSQNLIICQNQAADEKKICVTSRVPFLVFTRTADANQQTLHWFLVCIHKDQSNSCSVYSLTLHGLEEFNKQQQPKQSILFPSFFLLPFYILSFDLTQKLTLGSVVKWLEKMLEVPCL